MTAAGVRNLAVPKVTTGLVVGLIAVCIGVLVVRVPGARWLSETSSPTWARTLLVLGVEPNASIPGAVSPLERQAMVGNDEIVRLMLEAGADTEQRNKAGWRPLFTAAHGGHLRTVQILVEVGGADVNAVGDCHTAHQLAVEYGHAAIAEYLAAHGARTDAPRCD